MKREITNKLVQWKDKSARKPLVLQGVRQCGKTYTVKEFGRDNFKRTIIANFEKNKDLQSIFKYNFDTERILSELAISLGVTSINTAEDLIFFDEIQECPEAITSLKYFCEDHPDMYIIAAGSLLGPAIAHKNISFPVGKVEFLEMYPLSLKEYLMAAGYEKELKLIDNFDLTRPIPDELAERLARECRNFYAVGGMPEAVSKWIETRNWEETDEILNQILTSYANDFGKYLNPLEALKVNWIWESIPVQLAKENNKFVFSHAKPGKRAADLEDALQWLDKAGLAYKLTLVENPALPLSFNADKSYFKVFLFDIGLLRIRCGLSAESVINSSAMFSTYRGALTENFVMTELIKLGYQPYFWRSNNSAEVDFLIESKERIVPIEVKAENNTKAKSYSLYTNRYSPSIGFKFSMNNVGDNIVNDTLTYSLPLYLIFRLNAYLTQA